jgi:glutamyl-tRNA synthetase
MTPRFRFAPSPTGAPHVGNLHTALFSWALSRALRGDFVLRIEDTDPARRDPHATREMMAALEWLGIDWDEGPDLGGPYEPYRQSERIRRHREVAARLFEAGHAYYGDDPDGDLGAADSVPLRLRLPRQGTIAVEDGLRGRISFDAGALSDPALLRGDGTPLYHLAAMVDDHDMAITHVVRGEEWLPSAPANAYLYRVLGWEEPVWIHLPLILNRQRQKLAKRDPEGGYLLRDFQDAGYLPEALFNYLLLLGWSPDGEQEIVDKWTVRRQFRLERLSRSPAIFDWDKLNWVNRHYINELSDGALAEQTRPYLEEKYKSVPGGPRWLEALVALVRPELDRLADVTGAVSWAFEDDFEYTDSAVTALAHPAAGPALVRLVALVAQRAVLLDRPTAEHLLERLREDLSEYRPAQIFQPIRAALMGDVDGPPLPDLMPILGPQRVMSRLARAIKSRSSQ